MVSKWIIILLALLAISIIFPEQIRSFFTSIGSFTLNMVGKFFETKQLNIQNILEFELKPIDSNVYFENVACNFEISGLIDFFKIDKIPFNVLEKKEQKIKIDTFEGKMEIQNRTLKIFGKVNSFVLNEIETKSVNMELNINLISGKITGISDSLVISGKYKFKSAEEEYEKQKGKDEFKKLYFEILVDKEMKILGKGIKL